ncbi:porin family protein [Flavobacterium sp.]|uniref:type IX secretion/gliding motility protein PorT/SprT n=1 Tax=Flavobacterium sp. TaxID=239 RepID=UPI00286D3FD9|nr:porin family protein [Flavobacterium sp.]
MKKIFLYILIFSATFCKAQIFTKSMFAKKPIINLENFDKQRVHFGFYLGFNNYDFKIDKKIDGQDIFVKRSMGFNVGLITNLRLTDYIDLRFEPGLQYGQRDLTFSGFAEKKDYFREVKSTYIHFPLLLKFSSKRIGNVRPYVLGGVSADLNLSSNSDSPDDNSAGRFRLLKNTSNYELGLGIDLYMEYFKFSPSIRGVFGTKNELIPDADPNSPWTGNIANIATRGIFVNFAFH